MRTFNISSTIRAEILSLASAIPEVYLEFDTKYLRLSKISTDGDEVAKFELVFIDPGLNELVIGEVRLFEGFDVEFDIFEGE